MHAPVWALAVGIAWGAIAGELPDIDHPKARVSRTGVAFGVVGRVLGLPARIVGVFIRGLRVTHRGPTHSLTFLALWAAIAAPLYVASGGVVLVALAWVVGKLAAVSHTGAHLSAQSAVRFLLAHVAVVYPYAVAATALGYLSHLVLDSLTSPKTSDLAVGGLAHRPGSAGRGFGGAVGALRSGPDGDRTRGGCGWASYDAILSVFRGRGSAGRCGRWLLWRVVVG